MANASPNARGPNETYFKRRNFRAVHISRRALDARKFDVRENYYHNRRNRIYWYVREKLAAGICLLVIDARKFSCAKICTFTVYSTCSHWGRVGTAVLPVGSARLLALGV